MKVKVNILEIIAKLSELIKNSDLNVELLTAIHGKLYRINKNVGVPSPRYVEPENLRENIQVQLTGLSKAKLRPFTRKIVEEKISQINKKVSNVVKRAELAKLSPEEKKLRSREITKQWLQSRPNYFKKWREDNPEYTAKWLKEHPEYRKNWLAAHPEYNERRKEYDKKYHEKKKTTTPPVVRVSRIETILKVIEDNGPITQKDICQKLNINQPTISHYLKTLIESGKVSKTKNKTSVYYSLNIVAV